MGTTLTSLLRAEKVGLLSVTTRTKEIGSLLEKLNKKNYSNPQEDVSDLAGIRVIAFLETDITTIIETIKNTFEVAEGESFDKSRELGTDRIGYRSFQFVCRLGEARGNLPEYLPYNGLKFEIQVRTVLQHAWAEIEHDRNYKFAGVLPKEIRRRLFLIAGMLELADREFANVSSEIESISEAVTEDAKIGKFDSNVSTVSLIAYLDAKADSFESLSLAPLSPKSMDELADEIILFGLETLADFDEVLERNRATIVKAELSTTYAGFVRELLMLEDAKKYFEEAWSGGWKIIDLASYNFQMKYNKYPAFPELLHEHEIGVEGDHVGYLEDEPG